MILSGKAIEGDLPIGIVRKTMLGKPIATVREYAFCTLGEPTPVLSSSEEVIEGHVVLDRRVHGTELERQIISEDDELYITLVVAPGVGLLLSGAKVWGAGGSHVSFKLPSRLCHATGGGTSDLRADAAERMRVADRGGYTEKEEAIYSDYCKLVGPGRTHKATVAVLMEKYDMTEPLVEATIRRVEECLK